MWPAQFKLFSYCLVILFLSVFIDQLSIFLNKGLANEFSI